MNKHNFNSREFIDYGEWQQPPLSAHFWVSWFKKDICKELDLQRLDGKLIMFNGHTIASVNDIKLVKNKLLGVYKNNDVNFFNNYSKETKKIIKRYLELIPKLEKFDSTTNANNLFKLFVDLTEDIFCVWYLSVILGDDISELLVSESAKHGAQVLNIMDNIPKKETLMMREIADALKIKNFLQEKDILSSIKKVKGNNVAWRMIQKHIQEYAWVGTHHFWGEPLTAGRLLNDIRRAEKQRASKAKIKFPAKLKFLVKISGEQSYWRQYLAETSDLVAFKARPLLIAISRKLGISYSDLILLTPAEITDFLNNSVKPTPAFLTRRKKDYFIFIENNKETVIDDEKEIKQLKRSFLSAGGKYTEEIKGMIASSGFGRGLAKVFLIPENMSKMKEGDILVTTMTTPDFVPLMKKAAAIVTDIGGLLSHAALISRELKKPCIIGTKIATKVLKDGDLVEVDADKGVVRIIK